MPTTRTDSYHGFIERLNSNGKPDNSFGSNGLELTAIGETGTQNGYDTIALAPDGQIVAGGNSFRLPALKS